MHPLQQLVLSLMIIKVALLDDNVERLSTGCLSQARIHGPGWDRPELTLPSRYFFIEHPDGCDDRIVRCAFVPHAGRCLAKVQFFNRTQYLSNRLSIVRYRLVEQSCENFDIVLYNQANEAVVKRRVSGRIHNEDCYCPQPAGSWSESMGCDSVPELYTRLDQDLSYYKESKVNFSQALKDSIERFAAFERSYAFCHYQIVDSKIYRKCYGEYVGFAQFMDDLLISLSRKVRLPDTQFIVNLGDWPLSSKQKQLAPIPIFSWCGSEDTYDIVLPTYEITEATLNMQGRVAIDTLAVFGSQDIPFDDKENKLFWRGRDSNKARLKLVELSKSNFDSIDAAFTNFFFFRKEMDKYGPAVPYTSFFSFFKYRYQLNIDGTVAAYRFPNLLAGSSLVLKQKSKYYEYFYHLLQNGTHYVSVAEDMSDLLSTMSGLIKAEGQEREDQMAMVENARAFALKYLLPTNVYCYYYKVIESYTQLLLDPVQLAPEMELVSKEAGCQCKPSKDEL